jgi:hypothetical protein
MEVAVVVCPHRGDRALGSEARVHEGSGVQHGQQAVQRHLMRFQQLRGVVAAA